MTIHQVEFLSQNRPGPQMGMGHYERLLITHLARHGAADGWRFGITFDGRAGGPQIDPVSLAPGLRSTAFLGFSTERLSRLPWDVVQAVMRVRTWPAHAQLYHALALTYPAPPRTPVVITIHDLPPARFPDEGTLPHWVGQAARQAAAIVTPSRFAQAELVTLLGVAAERVHVVPNGCEHTRFHARVAPADAATLAQRSIRGPFLMYVGGATQRKNVHALLAAWASVAAEYPDLSLVLAGPPGPLAALAAAVSAPRVVVAGYLDRASLPGVLKAAVALVYPSVYEGFGLPPLEAMALGVPVVAVRAGAVPEVVGSAALLAEDGTVESIAVALRRLLGDPDLARRLAAAGPARVQAFSWADHADRVLALYRQVLA